MRNLAISIDGERLGDLISLGDRYVLYTTHTRLQSLDGARFETPQAARREVARALARARRQPPMRRAGPPDRLSA
ncbi:MAG: hypothetical protein GVY27_01565 [Deinococcus-Thermus bacterium]|nr:hypothetical protein [Deinococcota bacterium]